MTVIALSRQVGSGGHTVAAALSERLGLRVVGRKELTEEASRRGLALPESFVHFASEDASGLGLNQYLSFGELEFDLALSGAPRMVEGNHVSSFLTEFTSQSREIQLTLQVLIYEVAALDNVLFVGAGAQILLAEIPQVLRVKIIAPVETRIERMMSAYSLNRDEATAAVRAGDQEQIDYNRAVFDEDWNNPELWDLVINSEALIVERITELIASAAASGVQLGCAAERLSEAATINRAFLDTRALSGVYVCAVPTPNEIVLRGDTPSDDVHDQIMRFVSSHASSANVTDRLRVHSLV